MEAPAIRSLLALLEAVELEHLRPQLAAETLRGLVEAHAAGGRPALLKWLKDLDVAKLSDRQKLATEFSRAHKAGRVQPTPELDVPPGAGDPPPGAPDPATGLRPGLVCFYSGGMEAEGGRKLLRRWLAAAAAFGFADQLVLDHPDSSTEADADEDDEAKQQQSPPTSWARYLETLVAKVNAAFGERRPILVLGHSLGGHEAFALAQRLGSARVKKLYVLAVRPVNASPSVLQECFGGVSTAAQLAAQSREDFLAFVCKAWGNVLLEEFVGTPSDLWPAETRETIDLMRRQYASPTVVGMQQTAAPAAAIDVPVLAVAGSQERPQGETAEKLQGWRQLTSAAFKLVTVPGDHFSLMQPMPINGKQATPLFDLLLADMLDVDKAAIDQHTMLQAMREVAMEARRKTASEVSTTPVSGELNQEAGAAAPAADAADGGAPPAALAPLPGPQTMRLSAAWLPMIA